MGFEDQKQALQGLWGQAGKDQLQWLVEEEMAIMVWKGARRARSFRLTPGKNGELVWGSGKFVLDPAFASGHQKAIWLSGEDHSEVFTWDFVAVEGPSKEGAPEPQVLRGRGRGRGKGRGLGKGKVLTKGHGKGKGKYAEREKGKSAEDSRGGKTGKGSTSKGAKGKSEVLLRHVDRADGVLRTYEEMLLLYGRTWSRMDILAYFMASPSESRGKGGKGKPYKGAGAGKAPGKGKGSKGYEPTNGSTARRIDPADGQLYSWEELRAFYAPSWTKRQTEAYWEQCAPGNQMYSAGRRIWL